jgi:uncharacterized protein (TIGR03435 family)
MRLLLCLVLLGSAAWGQKDFQVATIKPSAPDATRMMQIRGTRFATVGTTLFDLLIYAYNVHPSQIVGGPEWMQTAKFDVMADPETETRPSSDEMKAMLGRLLGERFHLVLRREKRDLPVFALVRSNKAVTLTTDDMDPNGIPTGGFEPPGALFVRNATLANYAAFLQRYTSKEISRPVVDQTGIVGHFDFDLHYTPGNGAPDADPKAPPGLFEAIQEQLGLKLELARAAVEVLRVESVTQPTAD